MQVREEWVGGGEAAWENLKLKSAWCPKTLGQEGVCPQVPSIALECPQVPPVPSSPSLKSQPTRVAQREVAAHVVAQPGHGRDEHGQVLRHEHLHHLRGKELFCRCN